MHVIKEAIYKLLDSNTKLAELCEAQEKQIKAQEEVINLLEKKIELLEKLNTDLHLLMGCNHVSD